jgi:hypothetical protein
MPSRLSWIDHSPAERERMQRVLALFQERETRDELGIGAIRDALADQLFPGTSTIQTRLRYMLFVPWIYREIERREVPSAKVAAAARQRELELTATLIPGGDFGIFGRTARGDLKRLPSSVYWAGLGTWGIRRYPGTQERYHRWLDELYRLRRAAHRREADDPEGYGRVDAWHPKLPPAPPGFPHGATFRLTRDEADFLRQRIVATSPGSLLAHLVVHARPADAAAAWMHPDYASFPPEARELLSHARRFAEAMQGAAVLYNLMLAEAAEHREREEEHRGSLGRWAQGLDVPALAGWDLDRFWALAGRTTHTVTDRARLFVGRWIELLRRTGGAVADHAEARALVRARETTLKRGRSRFTNPRALEQWGGYAGMAPITFRWPTVSTYLLDLSQAEEGAGDALA